MANAARHEPEAVATLRAGRDDKVNRLLRLPLPEPYLPSRIEAFRDRKQARPQSDNTKSKGPARKASRSPEPPLRPAFARTADRPARRSGGTARLRGWGYLPLAGEHHGSGPRQARRPRALEGQRYGWTTRSESRPAGRGQGPRPPVPLRRLL